MTKSLDLDRDSVAHLIAHRPFPELAAALRSQTDSIIQTWMAAVRTVVPSAADLPAAQLRDNLPAILARMADVMESASSHEVDRLIQKSPSQGLARLQQGYGLRELLTEGRLLRRIIVQQVEISLARRMAQAEHIALDMSIDTMLQEAVAAFITEQNERLRIAAEAELKYLSFLSHDLNNNLSSITLLLQILRQRLAASPDFIEDVKTLDAAQQSIRDTIGGMGQLLQSERLRKAGVQPERRPLRIHELATNSALTLVRKAQGKGLKIAVEIPPDIVIENDGELLGLVLQNLLGNAIKYSSKGTVRLCAEMAAGHCTLSVHDEGEGIAAEHLQHIFQAFRRGDARGEPGVGLGLSIAAQAAKLLGGTLAVQSTVGQGSTFSLTLAV